MRLRANHQEIIFVIGTLLFIILTVISLFLGSRYVMKQLSDSLVVNYAERETLAAQQIAQIIELQINGIQSRLLLAGELEDIQAGDVEACNAKLQHLIDLEEGKLGNLARVGSDGIFRCSLNADLIGAEAATLGPYIPDIFTDPVHAPVMSRAIRPVGATNYLVGFHVPVFTPEGVFDGTLGGAVHFKDLEETYLEGAVYSQVGFVGVYDDDGTVLYRPEEDLIGKNIESPEFIAKVGDSPHFREMIQASLIKQSGTKEYFADGVDKVSAYHYAEVIPGRIWTVVVAMPIEEVNEALVSVGVRRLLNTLWIAIASTVTLAGLGFIYFLMQWVFKPAEAIDKAKTEFVSLASHQLRTPLSAINWYTEMLLAGDAGKVTIAQRKFLDEIFQSNQRMVALVGSLLNVSRIDLGTFAIDPVPTDLGKLIDSVLSELRPSIEEKQLKVNRQIVSGLSKLQLDPKLIRIVVQNLLANAVKYTPANGAVSVEVTKDDKQGTFTLLVRDSGIGIPANAQSKIFTKLYRADNAREKDAEGNGLGLYIVKSIVVSSKGKIWFESQESKGTSFFVVMPLSGMQKKTGAKALDI